MIFHMIMSFVHMISKYEDRRPAMIVLQYKLQLNSSTCVDVSNLKTGSAYDTQGHAPKYDER